MSTHEFKQAIAISIDMEIAQCTSYLVEHTQADIAVLRLYQGRIAGLNAAKAIIQEIYKGLHG